ncbi:hypothetical protein [Archaeoglobus sulfaticallidus]|uniref:hypothetical protein n=1 Tax=Archaeoglobus sulfaticallidus TaxID=1316941 RepID=UPI00064F7B90|nr:hypothetical protein [Archaeoglobus sulfaticallidus]
MKIDFGVFLLERLKRLMRVSKTRIFIFEVGTTATHSFESPNLLRGVYMPAPSLKMLECDVHRK